MRALESGVELTREELQALAHFTGKGSLEVVHITVTTKGLRSIEAYATDGCAAICGESGEVLDGAQSGTWAIEAGFLRTMLKLIDANGGALLRIHGQNLTEAEVLRLSDGGFVRSDAVTSPRNRVVAQVEIGFLDSLKRLCTDRPNTYSAFPSVKLRADYLVAQKYVAAAAGATWVEVLPGNSNEDPVRFVARFKETCWVAVVSPVVDRPTEDERQQDLGYKHEPRDRVEVNSADGAVSVTIGKHSIDLNGKVEEGAPTPPASEPTAPSTKRVRKPAKKNAKKGGADA